MILLCLSALAAEISFYLHRDIEREEWMARQSFAHHSSPLFLDSYSKSLQKRGKSTVLLRNMLRWKGDDAEFFIVEQQLRTDPAVEWVFVPHSVVPPPPAETPNFVPFQEYLLSNPGMDIVSYWEEGFWGTNMTIADVEYGWGLFHEDLQGAYWNLEPDFIPHPDVETLGYEDHGTAVLGLLAAQENGFGCTGIANQAHLELITEYPQSGWDRPSAIARAIETLEKGEILLLEMQDFGHCETWACLVPAEINPEVWNMTRFAVDIGLVVVAAAGNGTQNLDDEWYEENYLSLGDSGAIVVGAGMPNLAHSWGLLNYGSRIDIQAWGYDVATLGLQTIEELDDDPLRSYTTTFSGTSASSALVAGALTLLQQWSLEQLGFPLSPEGIRNLIYDSGDVSVDYVPHINIVSARERFLQSDKDEDGFFDSFYGGRDCDDNNSDVHPNAVDIWYDGTDQNCDGLNDFDQDGDGYILDEDCNDEDVYIHPNATEIWYDGVDQNCDERDDFDQDEDGFGVVEDCNDLNADISPEQDEIWYDGIDQNCDGFNDFDQDRDGFALSEDCNDESAQIHPGATEIRADDIDQDCDNKDAELFGCSHQPFSVSFLLIFLSACCSRVRT